MVIGAPETGSGEYTGQADDLGFLRSILDTNVAAINVLDESGRIIYANQAAESILGLKKSKLVGKPYNAPDWEIRNLDGSPMPDEELPFRRLLDTGEPLAGFRHSIVWPDGTKRVLSISVSFLPFRGNESDGQRLIVAGLADITEQYRASLEARARRKLLERLAANVPGMVYQYQRWPDGRSAFTFTSPGILDIYGVSPSDVGEDASAVFSVIDDRDRPKVSASIDHSAVELSLWHCEYRINHPQHGLIWVEGRASPEVQADGSVLWHGHIQDITRRKTFEQQLELANHLVDRATVGFHVYRLENPEDDRSLRMVRVNPASDHLIGIPGNELEGRLIDEIFPALRSDGIPAVYADVVRTGESRKLSDTGFTGSDGDHRVFSVSAFPMPNQSVAAVFEDISETYRLTEALADSEARFRQLANAIGDVVWIRTPDKMLYINKAYELVFGRSVQSLYERPDSFLDSVHPEDRDRVFNAFQREMRGLDRFNEIYRIVRPDGTLRWVQVQSYPITDPGYEGRSAGSAVDITEQKNLELELERLASTDSLTGLLNRREFARRLEQEVSRALRSKKPSPVNMLMLDLDHFKRVNDRYGHFAGDDVLRQLSNIMAGQVRTHDLVARLGGEEFAIALIDADVAIARHRADAIRRAIAEHYFQAPNGNGFNVTVSIGIATLEPAVDDPISQALNRADKALYRAKNAGRNRVEE